jgi:hypothetical protein
MTSITSGEMAECDWLRSTFERPLFFRNLTAVHYVKTNACNETAKLITDSKFENYNLICYFN